MKFIVNYQWLWIVIFIPTFFYFLYVSLKHQAMLQEERKKDSPLSTLQKFELISTIISFFFSFLSMGLLILGEPLWITLALLISGIAYYIGMSIASKTIYKDDDFRKPLSLPHLAGFITFTVAMLSSMLSFATVLIMQSIEFFK